VDYYYRRFRLDGTWLVVHERLREKVRHKAGRATEPSAAAVDAQRVKMAEKGGYMGSTPARR
jgi:putative transposase